MAWSPSESAYVPVGHGGNAQLSLEVIRPHIQRILDEPDITVVAHHAKYDVTVLERAGFRVRPVQFDTMIAAYLLGETSVGLKDLAFRRLGFEMTEISTLIGSGRNQLTMDLVSADDAGDYACRDVEATLGLQEKFSPELEERELRHLFDEGGNATGSGALRDGADWGGDRRRLSERVRGRNSSEDARSRTGDF
ncbi:MAG: hypothetical protein R2839_11880 [Thermomicrobiales bacterium]